MKYGFDYIDGREVPQTVIEDDFTIQGKHNGTVHVENGTLTIQGELQDRKCTKWRKGNYYW